MFTDSLWPALAPFGSVVHMTDDAELFRSGFSRRSFLTAAGVVGAGTLAAPLLGSEASAAAATTAAVTTAPQGTPGDPVSTPRVNGLHLQFGADAASEVAVSWYALQPVKRARVLLGEQDGRYTRSVAAKESTYTDAKSGQVVYAYHAAVTGLAPRHGYSYAAVHEGAEPLFGSFQTAPRGRQPFTFTSFGDQGTPTTGRKYVPPAGVTIANPPFVNDNLGSPAAGDTTAGIERVQPLFHLFNGDLCYANLANDRVRTWSDFWENNSRSARNRPWMPAAGNHENELGNGPIGYQAYQTYFSLPAQPGQTDVTRGLWYSFTVGSVHVISLANDDVAYQDGGNSYVRGYSNGAQKAWLEKELRAARGNRSIDWIVVCMHQVAISTADQFNGADLGIRQEWVPLFDRYGVDLVVCGHEHHYERSHPIRGQQSNETLTPVPVATRTDVVDTTQGTVHMVLGGGGTSAPSNGLFFNPPACRVITAVGPVDPTTGKRPPIYVPEPAPWSAVRDAANSYGFAAFSVDPGNRPGGLTRITVTYYDVVGVQGELAEFESFTLQRRRSDG
ncbi:3',5'-cyclic AMP phosphodiesterase CpdA [Frankineae bacterium MT45]|nr:3',5'-cyclic AMP phosphodiesterase CpdA [Frankineae bacterium MT45]